jgi:hypothetical protein
MGDWRRLEQHYDEIYLIIDDLIAVLLYPAGRNDVEARTFTVAREFLSTGIDPDRTHIVLSSMVPEAHELAVFAGLVIDQDWCRKLFEESFGGLLNSYQRHQLELPRTPSVTETIYPQLHLASLTLGLGAGGFQGGEEMRGYIPIMSEIASALPPLTAPEFVEGPITFLAGSDGRHMATDNAVYLGASPDELRSITDSTVDVSILSDWARALGDTSSADKLRNADIDAARRLTADLLAERLAEFRDSSLSAGQVVDSIEAGALAARQRIGTKLAAVKHYFGVPGYARVA